VKTKITSRSMFMLWVGAAVSMAEIMTGALYAPMGFKSGLVAILVGHALGCSFLVPAGIIGYREKAGSMETTRYAFGKYGSYLFSALNVLQLMGWTAIMLIVAGRSLNSISNNLWGFDNYYLWVIVTGLLVILWLYSGSYGFNVINNIAVVMLFIFSFVMSYVIFKGGIPSDFAGGMSFGEGVETAVIMPLSWLPMVSDYTKMAESEKKSSIATWTGYFLGSSWMYIIGLATGLAYGVDDPTQVMLAAGMGVIALGIVIMSTVTTTFLDVYSSASSLANIIKGDERRLSLVMGAVGVVIALIFPMDQYQNFLYAIGSVFAPLFAVLVTDYFIFKTDMRDKNISVEAMAAWMIGVVLYYVILDLKIPIGVSIPDALITGLVYAFLRKARSPYLGYF